MEPMDRRFYASLFTSIPDDRWRNNAKVVGRLARGWPFWGPFPTWADLNTEHRPPLSVGEPVVVVVDAAGSLIESHVIAEGTEGEPFAFLRHVQGSVPRWLVYRRADVGSLCASEGSDPWLLRRCSEPGCGRRFQHQGPHHELLAGKGCPKGEAHAAVCFEWGDPEWGIEGLRLMACACSQFWAECGA